MLKYCFTHAIESLTDMEYWDQNSKKGKFITPIPSDKVRKHKCWGLHGKSCNKWARFALTIINKKDAFIADQICFTGSPIKKEEERNEAKFLKIYDKEVEKAIQIRYKKTEKLRRLK